MLLTLANKGMSIRCGLPLFLLESRTTLFTLISTCIMLTPAEELECIIWIQFIAKIRMSIATAAATNTDVFNGIEILQKREKQTEG